MIFWWIHCKILLNRSKVSNLLSNGLKSISQMFNLKVKHQFSNYKLNNFSGIISVQIYSFVESLRMNKLKVLSLVIQIYILWKYWNWIKNKISIIILRGVFGANMSSSKEDSRQITSLRAKERACWWWLGTCGLYH